MAILNIWQIGQNWPMNENWIKYCRSESVMWKCIVAAVVSLIPLFAYADKSGVSTLCHSNEKVVFSCQTAKNKLVSLCATSDLSAHSGQLFYRFGLQDNGPEFVYPETSASPRESFTVDFRQWAKGGSQEVHFRIGQYRYTVYSRTAVFEVDARSNGSGVRIEKAGVVAADLWCHDNTIENHIDQVLNQSGLFDVWPSGNPNSDLKHGIVKHDMSLIESALKDGADVNLHEPDERPLIATVADERGDAYRSNNIAKFDRDTDHVIGILLAHGVNLREPNEKKNGPIELLVNKVPAKSIRRMLDYNWQNDQQYRLHIGCLSGDPSLIEDALSHGANPNTTTRNARPLDDLVLHAMVTSYAGEEVQKSTLRSLDFLLEHGARIDEGEYAKSAGDIGRVFDYMSGKPNAQPFLSRLIHYASPEAKRNSYYQLHLLRFNPIPRQKELLAWLLPQLLDHDNKE